MALLGSSCSLRYCQRPWRVGYLVVVFVPVPDIYRPWDWRSGSDEFEQEEDALEAEAQIARADFTQQYRNRLRQHVAVRTEAAQGVADRPRPWPSKTVAAPEPTQSQHAKDKIENQFQALSKYSSRLRNLHMPYDLVGVGVNRKGPFVTANMKDKSDRATNEHLLNPRMRIILVKMTGRELIYEVNSRVSTGKKANVYHGHNNYALKIYNTFKLVPKDRDRYFLKDSGSVETRNLKRSRTAGIRCPKPIEVRENVLVMTVVGDQDVWSLMYAPGPHPRLKDADIPEFASPDLYAELLLMTRKMFVETKLIHADLSEYNTLYHVDYPPADPTPAHAPVEPAPEAPSVEHGHSHAFDFLRADLRNVEGFFAKRGVPTLGLQRTFDFAMRDRVPDGGGPSPEEAVLRAWMAEPAHGSGGVSDGEPENSICKDTIWIVAPGRGKGGGDPNDANANRGRRRGEESASGDEDEDAQEGRRERKPRGHRHGDKEAKKVRAVTLHERI
ncbi:RIO1 family-domain-containing protein [Trametes elegans]|nr:RIO1 family-domain-containing protein [Trametes elegans]